MNDNEVILQYLESIDTKIDKLKDDLSPRVHRVEAWQNNADGKITVIGIVAVAVGSAITWIANKISS